MARRSTLPPMLRRNATCSPLRARAIPIRTPHFASRRGFSTASMETNFAGFVIDPEKCSQLSLDEKRELVHEISLWADNPPEILQSWSRRELRQLICAELGKERKYAGVTKPKMIAHLLNLISLRKMSNKIDDSPSKMSISEENTTDKRKRKKEYLLAPSDLLENDLPVETEEMLSDDIICQNVSCRATLITGDDFCWRCSCCICHQFDENMDSSLWIVCNSDPPYNTPSCGRSCHLKCALEHQKDNGYVKEDGCFYCFYCGKLNWLIRCWQKQLSLAQFGRTVYQLLPRLLLCFDILEGSERYKELHDILDAVINKLKYEIGPFDKVPAKVAQCTVKQLACGTAIRNLLSLAATKVEALLSSMSKPQGGSKEKSLGPPICQFQFESIYPVSVVVSLVFEEIISGDAVMGYRLWHRKSDEPEYAEKPTYVTYEPETWTIITQLIPSTEYYFKVSLFGTKGELGICEAMYITQASKNSCSNISSQSSDSSYVKQCLVSALDEEKKGYAYPLNFQADSPWGSSTCSGDNGTLNFLKGTGRNCSKVLPLQGRNDNNERIDAPFSDDMPFVCSNSDHFDTQRKSLVPKDIPDAANKKETTEGEYEYCVKVIRWLECEGHMEKDFRVKFLTWFSLKATVQERRVVKAFIDVLVDEPESLVDQLIDAFVDGICTKENQFCQVDSVPGCGIDSLNVLQIISH